MVLNFLENAGLGPSGPGFWFLLAMFLAGAFLVVHAWRVSREAAGVRAALEKSRLDLTTMQARLAELEPVRAELDAERAARQRIETEAAAAAARFSEREAAMAELRQRMETDFQAAASKMLENAHHAFLQRANETFERHRESAKSEGETRRKALDELLRPVSETLVRYEKGLSEMRNEHAKSSGDLIGRMAELTRSNQDVRREAHKLSTALRAGAKVRGRWGEAQLRNVVEAAGMNPYVDFIEQKALSEAESRKLPDMVVKLPGGRKIAVDSKVSINAYLEAIEAEDESLRAAKFTQHADDLWNQVRALARKDYAADMRDGLDVTVMFVPGENYFAAAVDARPAFIEDAFAKNVLVATPMTLIALLKAVSFNWRQEKATENAEAVAAMAKDLHDSLRKMSEHLGGLGKALETAMSKYNAAVGSYEGRVLSRARKFSEFELPGIEADIPELGVLEASPRVLRDQRAESDDSEAA